MVLATAGAGCAVRAQSSRLAVFGGLGISFNICRGTFGRLPRRDSRPNRRVTITLVREA